MAAVHSTSGFVKQPPQWNGTAIRNDNASGLALRESLFNGTLSAEAQHALMHMGSLRQGLIGRPVPHEVRKAVVTAPMNSNLRAVLLSEISLASSTPAQTASPGQTTPGPRGSAPREQPTNRPEHLWQYTDRPKSSATPSKAAGRSSEVNVTHADAGNLKRKRDGSLASAASETTAPTKRSSFNIASKLMSSLFTASSNAPSDPQQDGPDAAGEGYDSSIDSAQGYVSAEDADSHRDAGAETTSFKEIGKHASENMITTASGRPYTEWHFANGNVLHTYGALLPDRYVPQLNPDRPWACPVVDCREIFSDILGLGSHFKRDHTSACMNDNGDGTLSVVSYRKDTGPCPATVVSRTPQSPRPSATTPILPVNSVEDSTGPPPLDSGPTYENQRLHKAVAPVTSTWDVIHPHLGAVPYSPIPQKGHVPGLLPLPRKREIEFNSQANKFFVSRPQDISAMIIQITGNESPTACTRCRQGRGPFRGCVVVCTSAPDDVKQWVKSCANCFYKGNQKLCDVPRLPQGGQSVVPAALPRPIPSAAAEKSLAKGSARRFDGTSPSLSDDVPMRGIHAGSHDAPMHETHQLPHSGDAPSSGRQPGSQETPTYETRQPRHRAPASPDRTQGRWHSTRPIISVSNEGPATAEDMVLEEWEIAPGRICDATSPGIENIAFSSSYLIHSEEVAVNRDLGFNVLVVKGGTTHRWETMDNKMRICSIATGKVKVMILGQELESQEFEIGRNGMFRIKRGTSCTAENPHYGEATIHVCTMPDDYDF